MTDPLPSDLQVVLDHAWQSAQRLAMDVIEYPPEQRDEVMRRMGSLFAEVAQEAGCTHEIAQEFGDAMEQTVRDYVAEIEASGGGVPGTA
jgi:predicted HAD superfamily phosphohydrolase